MRALAVSTILAAVVSATFASPVVGQDVFADDIEIESDASLLRRPPRAVPERLPEPQAELLPERRSNSASDPIHLPPIEPTESDDRLTLAEAEALATTFHPALREAEGRVRAAMGNRLQVGLRPNPEIGYSGVDMGEAGTAGKQGGFISQEFITGGKLGLSRAVASREVAAAEQRFAIARFQVITTARVHYIDVLAAERSLALARQLTEFSDQSVRTSEELLRVLEIPRLSLLQSQIERESTVLLETQAIQRHDAAWRRLAAVTGIYEAEPVVLEDAFAEPLPELQWEASRERLLAESPELAELRSLVDRARCELARASAGRVPNLNVQAGVAHDNATDEELADVQLSMPLPVFNRNQLAIARAAGELAAAEAALEQRELALEQRLARALGEYVTARQRVSQYAQRVLPAARESLDITSGGYRDGELDYLDVLSAQRTYAEKNLTYLQDLETAWKKWAEIDGLLVGTLPDGTE